MNRPALPQRCDQEEIKAKERRRSFNANMLISISAFRRPRDGGERACGRRCPRCRPSDCVVSFGLKRVIERL